MFRALIALLLLASPASAQMVCGDRDRAEERLKRMYNEVIVSRGLSSAGTMIETFADYEDGSFTVLVTRPNKRACVVASGWGFDTVHEGKKIGEAL